MPKCEKCRVLFLYIDQEDAHILYVIVQRVKSISSPLWYELLHQTSTRNSSNFNYNILKTIGRRNSKIGDIFFVINVMIKLVFMIMSYSSSSLDMLSTITVVKSLQKCQSKMTQVAVSKI